MNFHFVTVVWGESFTDFFLTIALPNQLSPGNLHSFTQDVKACYKIYTTSGYASVIRDSKSYARLLEIMSAQIVCLDDINLEAKYQAMSECHRHSIREAVNTGATLVFLPPDAIWAEGSFRNMLQLAKRGKRVILVGGIRVVKESVLPVLTDLFSPERTSSLSSRELVKIAMEHLHPSSECFFWDSPNYRTDLPCALYWRVGNEGLLGRYFHLHPIMVTPYRKDILPTSTIDDDFIALESPSPNELHIVDDSEEMFSIGIDSALSEASDSMPAGKANVIGIARWAASHANYQHREHFKHKIRFHSFDISPAWDSTERYSDKIVNNIFFWTRIETLLFPLRGFIRLIKTLLGAPGLRVYHNLRNLFS